MDTLPASRFKRFLAYVIDGFILLIVPSAINFILKKTPLFSTDITASLIYTVPSLVLCILYIAFFESSGYKATPGKKIFNLYIVTTDGNQLSFKRALTRYMILALPNIIFLLIDLYLKRDLYDYNLKYTLPVIYAFFIVTVINIICILPVFFTKKRQGIHDLLTHTVVYRKK